MSLAADRSINPVGGRSYRQWCLWEHFPEAVAKAVMEDVGDRALMPLARTVKQGPIHIGMAGNKTQAEYKVPEVDIRIRLPIPDPAGVLNRIINNPWCAISPFPRTT